MRSPRLGPSWLDSRSLDDYGVSLTDGGILKQGIYKTAATPGYEGLTTHMLRHWFVSTLTWAGVPRNVIKDIVGHEDGDDDVTTIYTHAYNREETFAMVRERCAAIGFGTVVRSATHRSTA